MSRCEVDRPLSIGALAPNARDPWSHETKDRSVVFVEAGRRAHLSKQNGTNRITRYLTTWENPQPKCASEIAHRLFAHLLALELRLTYVVKRAVLNPHPNHVYVFENRSEVMLVPISSFRLEDGVAADGVQEHHTPSFRLPAAETRHEPPCTECDGVHLRALVSYFTVGPTTRKARIIQGLASTEAGDWFDPVNHCEWFTSLPAAWTARVDGPTVTLRRPDGVLRWDDDQVGVSRNASQVGKLSERDQFRLAASYRHAHLRGVLTRDEPG